mmetsp:Transcript_24213/g.33453  ORF Transcript_24213/g.33453 Transcript_24213/m.33453 type:complete len:347 (+) Transcript_24213:106-1146(+)
MYLIKNDKFSSDLTRVKTTAFPRASAGRTAILYSSSPLLLICNGRGFRFFLVAAAAPPRPSQQRPRRRGPVHVVRPLGPGGAVLLACRGGVVVPSHRGLPGQARPAHLLAEPAQHAPRAGGARRGTLARRGGVVVPPRRRHPGQAQPHLLAEPAQRAEGAPSALVQVHVCRGGAGEGQEHGEHNHAKVEPEAHDEHEHVGPHPEDVVGGRQPDEHGHEGGHAAVDDRPADVPQGPAGALLAALALRVQEGVADVGAVVHAEPDGDQEVHGGDDVEVVARPVEAAQEADVHHAHGEEHHERRVGVGEDDEAEEEDAAAGGHDVAQGFCLQDDKPLVVHEHRLEDEGV